MQREIELLDRMECEGDVKVLFIFFSEIEKLLTLEDFEMERWRIDFLLHISTIIQRQSL